MTRPNRSHAHTRQPKRLGWAITPHDYRVYQHAVDAARRRIEQDIPRVVRQPRTLLLAIHDRLLDPDLSIKVLMRDLRICKNQIRPAFRIATGDSPADYIRARRLEVAERLLRGTRLEVHKVARLVGYRDVRCFARVFRVATGVTPSDVARVAGR